MAPEIDVTVYQYYVVDERFITHTRMVVLPFAVIVFFDAFMLRTATNQLQTTTHGSFRDVGC